MRGKVFAWSSYGRLTLIDLDQMLGCHLLAFVNWVCFLQMPPEKCTWGVKSTRFIRSLSKTWRPTNTELVHQNISTDPLQIIKAFQFLSSADQLQSACFYKKGVVFPPIMIFSQLGKYIFKKFHWLDWFSLWVLVSSCYFHLFNLHWLFCLITNPLSVCLYVSRGMLPGLWFELSGAHCCGRGAQLPNHPCAHFLPDWSAEESHRLPVSLVQPAWFLFHPLSS